MIPTTTLARNSSPDCTWRGDSCSCQPLSSPKSATGLNREGGARAEAIFLRSLADGDFDLVDLTKRDYGRMAELVLQYGDLPLGTTDASVIAIAERLRISEVATLDKRHFTVVRPAHVDALTLLP